MVRNYKRLNKKDRNATHHEATETGCGQHIGSAFIADYQQECDKRRDHTEGSNIERLPGFLDRAQTISSYEEISGERVHDIEYYELLAGMRFSVILTRLGQQLMDQGFLPGDTDFEWNNPVSNLHAKQLIEMGIR